MEWARFVQYNPPVLLITQGNLDRRFSRSVGDIPSISSALAALVMVPAGLPDDSTDTERLVSRANCVETEWAAQAVFGFGRFHMRPG